MRWPVLTASLFALLLYGQQINAAIFETDDRQPADTMPGSVYSPIGVVIGTHKYGTGTLVDECHVLTSQHIFGNQKSPLGKPVRFVAGFGPQRELKSGGVVVAAGGLDSIGADAQPYEERARDWVLIRLDVCLGQTLGFAELTAKLPDPRTLAEMQSAGFPVDKPRTVLTIDPACRITSARPLVWLNDCAALAGNSGGPIFQIVGSGSNRHIQVYAIQSGAIRSKHAIPLRVGWDNQATPAWVILPYVMRFLRTGQPCEPTCHVASSAARF